MNQTPQSYAHHVHHPIPTYVATALLLAAITCLAGASWLDWKTHDPGVLLLALVAFVLIGTGRLCTTKLQDRIIQLEMALRCADQTELFSRLSIQQVIALRFAFGPELGPLLARAVNEQMPPDAIKRAIQNWKPDNMRT
jgi:hypothetical protein